MSSGSAHVSNKIHNHAWTTKKHSHKSPYVRYQTGTIPQDPTTSLALISTCINLWPTQDIIKNIDQYQREWIQEVCQKTGPERKCGAEAGKGAHHDAHNTNNQHFSWEVPGQFPEVNKGQEHW